MSIRQLLNSTAMNMIMNEADPDGGDGGGGGDPAPAPDGGTPQADGGAQGDQDPDTGTGEGGDGEPAKPDPQTPDPASGFKIPDEYKENKWADGIKTEEDLWKKLAGSQELIGKKHATPDAGATDEEWDEFYKELTPKDASVYDFGEGANERFAEAISPVLLEAGISERQSQKLIPAYQKFEQEMLEEQTNEAGFNEVMKASFGDDYDGDVKAISNELKTVASEGDQKLIEAMPNEYLGAFYRTIRAMQKEYGASEKGGDAHTAGKTGAPAQGDWKAQASEIRKQMNEMTQRPHTAIEKQELQDKLDALYKNNTGKK